ncbi:hypothetical protein, partial [Vibrio crassostreae]|uniref:hypothetical protein n=1 Tax=Vibrio crassostreae TaxID=246167 RepID=UPI001C968B4D
LVSLARRAYHFQQLASSSTPFHECRTYYLKSGITYLVGVLTAWNDATKQEKTLGVASSIVVAALNNLKATHHL